MQMIIQFPFERRYRTAFTNVFIQHIPLVNSSVTKRNTFYRPISHLFLLILMNDLSSLTEIS